MTTETFGRALNRAAFFASVRSSLFKSKLSEKQVQGVDALLDAAPASMPLEHLVYCLATAYHETANTMQAIKEYGGATSFKNMYDIKGSRPAKARARQPDARRRCEVRRAGLCAAYRPHEL
jgi:putative chitinase